MNLYIIGNGFDKHNGLHTDYYNFARWVKKYYPDKYEVITELFGLDELWSNFEDKIEESLDSISAIIDEENDWFDYSGDHTKPWREDSDRSYFLIEQVGQRTISSSDISDLLKEWLNGILLNSDIKPIETSSYIVNFNYTDYLKPLNNNILHIHEKYNDNKIISLQIGHSKHELEKRLSHVRISNFGNNDPDPNFIYNQLRKFINVSITLLKGFLFDKEITKLIFFGFSFGKQDLEYFNIFDENIPVDFYVYEDDNKPSIVKRVNNKFKNVKFYDSNKWKGFKA